MAENNKSVKQDEFGQATPAREQSKVQKGAPRGTSRRVSLNVFDLIIIFLVLLVVVLLAVGVRVGDLFGIERGTDVRLTYTVLMTDVDEGFAGSIRVGDLVYDADSGVALGRVCEIPTSVAHTEVGLASVSSDAQGNGTTDAAAVMKPVPGRVDVTVKISCDQALYYEGRGYEIDGRTVRMGDVYTLRFPSYVGGAVCSSLTAQKTN